MKQKKRTRLISAVLALALLMASLLVLSSCHGIGGNAEILTKSELLSNVKESKDKGYEYASDYLDDWNFPQFSLKKLHGLENVFISKFVEEVGDPYERARLAAISFLDDYYDVTDLSSVDNTTDAIINAYVSTFGDKYSVYRTAEEYDDYKADLSGSFVGIGVTVRYFTENGDIKVERVHGGSGAEAAGILVGDFIISVNGTSIEELGYDGTISSIRGEEGTTVTLGVRRDTKELSFDVIRKKITEDTVILTIDGSIAYIEITAFKSNTYNQFKNAIDTALEAGVCGIVYDLRNNSGGYLSAVTDMLAYICPKGTTIVSFTNDYAKPTVAKNAHTVSLPSVVICNENTASAAELFTSAIRDFSDMGLFPATIVGTVTFGKGIMQSSYPFSDGSSITLTVAYYNPPLGENYHAKGIVPDVEVENGEEGDAQMDAARAAISSLINK